MDHRIPVQHKLVNDVYYALIVLKEDNNNNNNSCVCLPRMAIHTATGEASRVYSISENRMADGCFLRGGAASCFLSDFL